MAITPVDSGFLEITTAAATWTLPAPPGLAPGDVLHIAVTTATASLTMSSKPAEAALQTSGSGGSMTGFVYIYVTPATPPASLSFTLSAATTGSIAWDWRTGVDTTSPVDAGVGRSPANGTTSATSWAPPAITTVTDGAEVVGGLCVPSGSRTVTPPPGWSVRATATGRLGYLATKGIQATAGSTGAATSFVISSTALNGFAWQLALRPATSSGTAYTGAPSDALGITDAVADDLAAGRSAADPLGLTDTVAQAASSTRSQSDALGAADATALDRGTGATDAAGLTDAVALSVSRTPADTVGMADQVQAVFDERQDLTDALGLVDAVNAVLISAGGATPSDPLGLTDSASAAAASVRAASDPLGATDQVSAVLSRVVTVADLLGLIDQATAAAGPVANPSDALPLSDAAARALDTRRPMSDPAGLADQLVAVVLLDRPLVDPLALTDTVTAVRIDGSIPPLPDELTLTAAAAGAHLEPDGAGWTLDAADYQLGLVPLLSRLSLEEVP